MGLREIRRAKNFTQQRLANEIKVDCSVISKYEKGIINPPIFRLKAIADVLGVPVNELYSDTQRDTQTKADGITEDSGTTLSKQHELEEMTYYEYVLDLTERDLHADLIVFYHNKELEEKIRAFANNKCELCGQAVPASAKGDEYLELHCIRWLREGGLPEPQNMVMLCPNCHKTIHLSDDPDDEIRMLRIASKHKYLLTP